MVGRNERKDVLQIWEVMMRDRLDKDIQYLLYKNVFKSIDGMTKQGVGKDFLEAFFSLDSLELQKIDLTSAFIQRCL